MWASLNSYMDGQLTPSIEVAGGDNRRIGDGVRSGIATALVRSSQAQLRRRRWHEGTTEWSLCTRDVIFKQYLRES